MPGLWLGCTECRYLLAGLLDLASHDELVQNEVHLQSQRLSHEPDSAAHMILLQSILATLLLI